MRRSPAARLVRTLAAGLLVSAPFALSACAFTPASAEDRAEAVVSEFFELLESGDAEGVVPLLTEDSALRKGDAELLTNDFYANTVARPTDATIVMSGEFEPGVTYVTVEYLIAGSQRTMKVAVEEKNEKAHIASWVRDALTIMDVKAPGAFEINGSFLTPGFGEAQLIYALPGVYNFEYTDPEGWGTLDTAGTNTEPFEVEFPIEKSQLAKAVPDGVDVSNSSFTPAPQLTKAAAKTVEDDLSSMARTCSEQDLRGEACPVAVLWQGSRHGAPDPGSVTWKDESLGRILSKDTWKFEARYNFTFTVDGRHNSVWVELTGALIPDEQGKPSLDFNAAE